MHRSTAIIATIGVLAGGIIATGSAHAAEVTSPAYVTITSNDAPVKFRGIVHTGKKPTKKNRLGVATCELKLCTISTPRMNPTDITKPLFVTPVTKAGKPTKNRYLVLAGELPDISIPEPPGGWTSAPEPSLPSDTPGLPDDTSNSGDSSRSPGSTPVPSDDGFGGAANDIPADPITAASSPRSAKKAGAGSSTSSGRTLAQMQASLDKKAASGTYGPQAHPNGLGGLAYAPGSRAIIDGVVVPANAVPVCPLDHYDGDIYNDSPVLWNGIQISGCAPRPGLTKPGLG